MNRALSLFTRHSWGATLGGALLALLVTEGGIRSIYSQRLVNEPGYERILAPGSTVTWGLEGHARSHWTDHGARGTALPAGTEPRVLVLGDSQTEGLQVEDEEVLTSVAERRLVHFGSKLRVINAGRASASPADYILYADRFRDVFRPKWTVIVVNDDDFVKDAFDRDRAHLVQHETGTWKPVAGPLHPMTGPLWWLRHRSMLVAYAYVRGGQLVTAARKEPPLFRAADAEHPPPPPPVAAPPPTLAPFLDALARAYDEKLSILYLAPVDWADPSQPTTFELALLEACTRRKIHCVSPRRRYPEWTQRGRSPFGHANLAFNSGHLNVTGHQILGEELAEHLSELQARELLEP